MDLNTRNPSKFILSLLLTFGALWLCWQFGETILFDKFVYYKSQNFGYFVPNKNNLIELFGDRAVGYQTFKGEKGGKCDMRPKIILIGDSYLWGMGVKNQQTTTSKLRQLLPNNEVQSYAYPGSTLIDYLAFYTFAESVSPNNFYVFLAVNNDALADSPTKLATSLANRLVTECQKEFPKGKTYVTPDWASLTHEVAAKQTTTATTESWSSDVNICVASAAISLIPKQQTAFLITDEYRENGTQYSKYQQLLQQSGHTYWNSLDALEWQQFNKYKNQTKGLQVSKQEIHPSSVAHQIYAEVIYRHIFNSGWLKKSLN